MTQHVLIIDGHPDPRPERLCHALAAAYREGAVEAGHEVRTIAVAKLSFPLLTTQEEFQGGEPPADIKSAQDDLKWCDHLVIIYPLWLGTIPALFKGFLEHTFRPGFAFDEETAGWPQGKLAGSARIIVTMGMPGFIYRWYFGAHSLKSLEHNILRFAGLGPVRETIYGMVDSVSTAEREGWLGEVRELGRRCK